MLRKIVVIGFFLLILFFFLFFYQEPLNVPQLKIQFPKSLTGGLVEGIKHVVKQFNFASAKSLNEWQVKVLKRKVDYFIETDENAESYVRALSENAASALYYKVDLDINKKPIISWKWRVDEFPKRKLPEKINQKKEEDFAARIYVIFPAAFFTNSKVIEYIWAEKLPVGTIDESAYSSNIKIMVLQSGVTDNQWRVEKRNIYEDYELLYGKKPKLNVGAISFMTDADSTRTEASAVYDDINIGYEE